MQTLTYGMQVPETGDKGSVFFPALEDNFTQLDAHNHNGTNSATLTTTALTPTSQTILAASWVASTVTGLYEQTITTPAGITYDARQVFFKNSTTKDPLYLSTSRVGASQYKVYINDNSIGLTAIYV